MKVVVAIDSFKGSMTSMQAGMACKEGILAAIHRKQMWWSDHLQMAEREL